MLVVTRAGRLREWSQGELRLEYGLLSRHEFTRSLRLGVRGHLPLADALNFITDLTKQSETTLIWPAFATSQFNFSPCGLRNLWPMMLRPGRFYVDWGACGSSCRDDRFWYPRKRHHREYTSHERVLQCVFFVSIYFASVT